jgi:hypothetical protein
MTEIIPGPASPAASREYFFNLANDYLFDKLKIIIRLRVLRCQSGNFNLNI